LAQERIATADARTFFEISSHLFALSCFEIVQVREKTECNKKIFAELPKTVASPKQII